MNNQLFLTELHENWKKNINVVIILKRKGLSNFEIKLRDLREQFCLAKNVQEKEDVETVVII